MPNSIRAALATCAFVSVVAMGGCSSAHSKLTTSGSVVRNDALKKIEPGRTTREALIAALGKPSDSKKTANGAEVLKYEWVENADNKIYLPFLINAREKKKTRRAVSFEIGDGVVRRHWQDSTELEKDSELR